MWIVRVGAEIEFKRKAQRRPRFPFERSCGSIFKKIMIYLIDILGIFILQSCFLKVSGG
ncbi:hypothetical protein LEP1GSC082_2324 [Leptospira kirschneri str. H2]|nr:hypothetical protein LEP1GSC082_2324 [Leptospira kirschneri str. H2]